MFCLPPAKSCEQKLSFIFEVQALSWQAPRHYLCSSPFTEHTCWFQFTHECPWRCSYPCTVRECTDTCLAADSEGQCVSCNRVSLYTGIKSYILDGGSQRTYVTSRIQKMLSLPTSHMETVSIKTFGMKMGSRQSRSVVKLDIITRDSRPFVISALVVPHIQCMWCHSFSAHHYSKEALPSPISSRPSQFSRSQWQSLSWFAPGIGLLLGSVIGRVRRGADGSIANEMRLGWVLSDPVDGITCEQSVTNFVSTYMYSYGF